MKKVFLIFLITAAIVVSAHYTLRNYITEKIISHLNSKLQSRYGLSLVTKGQYFSSYKTLVIPHLAIVPEHGDTLLTLDSLSVSPSFLALVTLKIRLNELKLAGGELNLSCIDSTCNYTFKKSKNSPDTVQTKKDYAGLLHGLYSKLFDIIPEEAEVDRFIIAYKSNNSSDEITLVNFKIKNERSDGEFEDSSGMRNWKFELTLNRASRLFDFEIYPTGKNKKLPFLSNLLNLTLAFDTLQFSTNNNKFKNDEFALSGNLHTKSLLLFQPRLSDDSIRISNVSSTYNLQITPASISLDSTTFVDLNEIRLKPFIRYISKETKDYFLILKTESADANDFFQSLPEGMFNEIEGIEASGKLAYSLDFHLNSSEPDSLTFNSQMKKENFRIKKFGDNSLVKMNSEFPYTAYEYDKPFRTFAVGPSNPNFTPLDQTSPYLRNAILTSEDGSFFFHNGFNEDAFRKSIATNYKEGKFKRGGSTISMQLIKNVYLSRHKTIARKAEEALIVWLIESNHLVSKERMFEVYLNIIELGPGVYGIGEASEFYFNKKPSQLTLSESIFIASLLPHPKWFKYSFDEQGNLKPYFADYYRVVSNFMLRKNLINQEEYDNIHPNVKLTGLARAAIIPSDTIPPEEWEEDKGY